MRRMGLEPATSALVRRVFYPSELPAHRAVCPAPKPVKVTHSAAGRDGTNQISGRRGRSLWNLRQVDQPALIKGKVTTLADSLEKAEQAGIRICFIDTPPALGDQTRDVLRLADLIIIPTRPSSADLWALGSTLKLANDVGKPFVFIITQAKANTRLTLQTMAALSDHGPVASSILGDRVDYASALIDGRAVLETDRSGLQHKR